MYLFIYLYAEIHQFQFYGWFKESKFLETGRFWCDVAACDDVGALLAQNGQF